MEEPDANTYLMNLALDTKDYEWLKHLQNLEEELNENTLTPIKHKPQKLTINITFSNYSIEDYRGFKEYLQDKTLEEKIKYFNNIGVDVVTGLFVIEKVLK